MLRCSLLSPSAEAVVEDASLLVVRATSGEMGIMSGHLATVAQLTDGSTVRLATNAGERIFHIGTGSFLRFESDQAVVLTSDFDEE